MSNSGQSCDAPTRMLVEKSIYERAVEDAVDEANKIKVDQASKKGDHIGPVISKIQYDKITVLNYVTRKGILILVFKPNLDLIQITSFYYIFYTYVLKSNSYNSFNVSDLFNLSFLYINKNPTLPHSITYGFSYIL